MDVADICRPPRVIPLAFLLAAVVPLPGSARAQDTPPHTQDTASLAPGGGAAALTQPAANQLVDRETFQALDPAALPQNVGVSAQVRKLRGDVFQVNPELLSRLRPGQRLPPSVLTDSAQFVTARLGSRVTRLENVPGDRPAAREVTFVLPDRAVSVVGDRVTRVYRPVIRVPRGGLELAGTGEEFRGTLYVGVQDTLDPAASGDLPTPIEFQITGTGVEVEPSTVTVRESHVPYRPVSVRTRDLRDSIQLTVFTSLSPDATPLPVGLDRPSVELAAVPSREIPGLGLGTARLSVSLSRLGVSSANVRLTAVRGRPDPDPLSVGPEGEARAELRSRGLGEDTVTASLAGYRSDSVTLRYVFPWSLLVATVLGGLVGSGLRHLQGEASADGGRFLGEAAGGLLAAMIVAVAYTVGANFTGVSFGAEYGEALFFTLAAVGAYAWRTLRPAASPSA